MLFDPRVINKETVLKILNAAIQAQIEHKTLMTFNDEGAGGTFQFAGSPEKVIRDCTIALKKMDPKTYGPYIKRKRTICFP